MKVEGADRRRVVVARRDEIRPGRTKRFSFVANGFEIPAFALNHGGALHAYINRCRHVPMELDWVENRFFTEDGRFILCATHGACYEPDSGECVSGPPFGKHLIRVPLEIEDGEVIATLPESEVTSAYESAGR
jgi:nitrite reductase/ring-hydroxylating ferredoxin subunit